MKIAYRLCALILVTACTLSRAIPLTPVLVPTEESSERTPAAIPTSTIFGSTIFQKCIQFAPNLPDNFIKVGSVIYASHRSYYALNQSVISLELRGDGLVVTADVSPNGEWLAYRTQAQEAGSFKLQVLSSKEAYQVEWSENWLPGLEWVSNEWLRIPVRRMPRGVVYLYNPFTRQAKMLEANYSNLYFDFLPESQWPGNALAVYDPTLSRVAYLKSDSKNGIVLWNLENRQELWHLDFEDAFRTRPEWSNDGNFLVVAGQKQDDLKEMHYEIFKISRDGVEEKLTEFISALPRSFIWKLKWSPNNRYLAFWLSIPESEEYTGRISQLYILDTNSHQVSNLCVRGGDHGTSPLIWSPDSQQLAVQIDPQEIETAVIDLETYQGIKFKADTLVGWMTSSPTSTN